MVLNLTEIVYLTVIVGLLSSVLLKLVSNKIKIKNQEKEHILATIRRELNFQQQQREKINKELIFKQQQLEREKRELEQAKAVIERKRERSNRH
ncbi:MAG: hypothetical protein LBU51_01850 [Bacteroidales bacterium]|jgi:hypothetical protein|nr:hypothetical protein [Bacteroidales bacterium]